jgi:hypothetical protein
VQGAKGAGGQGGTGAGGQGGRGAGGQGCKGGGMIEVGDVWGCIRIYRVVMDCK